MSNKPDWAKGAELKRVYPDTKIKPFSCGVDSLDKFLLNDVYKHSTFLGLVTYVLENEEETIAYYSLENDRLAVACVDDFWEEDLDINFKELYSDCRSFPAVKITQLAVNEKYQRQHIGTNLVEYIIGSFVNNTNKTGCQFLLVDALQSVKSRFFYDSMKFQYATVNDYNQPTRLLYLCLLGFSLDAKKEVVH